MIPYKFHAGNNYWDMSLIKDLLSDARYTEEEGDGCIYIVPGEYTKVKDVNIAIHKYKWVVLIITSDEQSTFKVEELAHPNIKIYVQYLKQGRHDKYGKWPLGYTSDTRKHLKLASKDLDFFFSGQVTHKRRKDCVKNLKAYLDRQMTTGRLVETEGFSQGLEANEYMGYMAQAKTAPAPSGAVCPDSFRTYEALEAGAIPIADNISPTGDRDYWSYLLGDVPFPTINNYSDLPGYIEDQLDNFQAKANRIQAWWIKKKRDLKQQLLDDVAELSGKAYKEAITVVVPVSPIKSHPSTDILEKCISSIRHHLNCEIIITFDGVSKHHEGKREAYEEFIRRALFLCNTKWNATPLIFDEHTHQVGMARKVLDMINTPTLLYIEGDTGLVVDKAVDFKHCVSRIIKGDSNLIRFHFEGVIPKEHEHMMLEEDDGLLQTVQWSQRPHLASTAYYRRILRDYFSENAISFIEDKMHGIVHEAYKLDGILGWQQHRLHVYAPDGDIKHSVDFDGRDGEKKWDEEQIF